MGLYNFEWDKDRHGKSILRVQKSRGKISITELQEELSRDYRFCGAWAVVFAAREDGFQCWGGEETAKGDVLELYPVNDGEDCPICAAVYSGVEYCPHCGERVREDAK